MPLSINTNVASLSAQRAYINTNAALETAFERMSTGKRINSAKDDAAGLAIGTDLSSRVSGLNQAIRNVNDGISMVQITEGTLSEVTTILQRMRDLAVQAANGGLTATERGYLDDEQSKLATTLDSVIGDAKYGNVDLVAGSATTSVTIQAGAGTADTTTIAIDGVSASSLGVLADDLSLKGQEVLNWTVTDAIAQQTSSITVTVGGTAGVLSGFSNTSATTETLVAALNASSASGISAVTWSNDGDTVYGTYDTAGAVSSTDNTILFEATAGTVAGSVIQEGGEYGISQIDNALSIVASDRAKLGATQAQLESTVRNIASVAENTAAAAGRIMDTDYAAETANLTKAQILQQAATSILAQANAQPQSVLALLQ